MNKPNSTGYPILDWMIKNQIPLTRQKYLELDHCGDVPQDVKDGLDQEYESSQPPQFRIPVDYEEYEPLEPTPEEIQAGDHEPRAVGMSDHLLWPHAVGRLMCGPRSAPHTHTGMRARHQGYRKGARWVQAFGVNRRLSGSAPRRLPDSGRNYVTVASVFSGQSGCRRRLSIDVDLLQLR